MRLFWLAKLIPNDSKHCAKIFSTQIKANNFLIRHGLSGV